MVRFQPKDNSRSGSSSRGKVLLATCNDAHRDAVSHYLRTRGHSIVTVESPEAALMQLHVGDVDMVVAGMNGSGEGDIALMRSVRRTAPEMPIVLLPAGDAERVRRSVEYAVEMNDAAQDRSSEAAERMAGLSERERQVVDMVVAGQSSKAIGVELEISCRTVENHRARIMAKVGVRNVAELVTLAMRAGLGRAPAPALCDAAANGALEEATA
jgi:DNA-binding NarL/FixJ family response regulator